MFCYLLNESPLWADLPNGKRNVRIIFLALCLYIIFHSVAFEYRDRNLFFKTFYGYFWWIIMADIFVCGCTYKAYYGRSVLKELDPYEKDIYDEKSHRYYPPDSKDEKEDGDHVSGDKNVIEEVHTPIADPLEKNDQI